MIRTLVYIAIFITLLFSCTSSEIPEINPKTPVLMENSYNVGFLVMDGVYNTELTAPFDIFHHTRFREGIKPMNVFTVAQNKHSILTFEGIRFDPDYTFDSPLLPEIDILVVPSAEHHLDSDLKNATMIDFVKRTGQNAEFVLSLCDGAFVLAQAGLLTDVKSTTFPADIDAFRNQFPNLDILDQVLFVHDQKFITSVGGAKSFEPALYLCELLYGKEVAERIAEGLVIDWELENLKYFSQQNSSPSVIEEQNND